MVWSNGKASTKFIVDKEELENSEENDINNNQDEDTLDKKEKLTDTDKVNSAPTKDTNNIYMWITLMLISGIIVICMVYKKIII